MTESRPAPDTRSCPARRAGRLARAAATCAVASAMACSGDPADPGSQPSLVGSITVAVEGLVTGAAPHITITGPGGTRTVTSASTVTGLGAGTYTVTAQDVTHNESVYAGQPATQSVTVEAGGTAVAATITYVIATGFLDIQYEGLPVGNPALIQVTGPGDYVRTVTDPVVLAGLRPGTFQVQAQQVQANGVAWAATVPTLTVVVGAGVAPSLAHFTYGRARGVLSIQVTGLPPGTDAAINVSGPDGYAASPTGTQTLTGIPPGTYTIGASPVGHSCGAYTPAPASQVIDVPGGQTTNASIGYAASAPGLNLCIDGAYITQSVQSYAGTVPLIADRPARLRVFVRATEPNAAQPVVRARFYDGPVLVSTHTVAATRAEVPTTIVEGNGESWDLDLPPGFLRPGMRVLVDVDPTNAIVEASDTDNAFPKSGLPATLDVRSVPPLRLTLVPVTQAATGLTGNLSEANKSTWTQPAWSMFPLGQLDAVVREPYLFTGPELGASGANWSTLLSELNTLRITEGTGRNYYGVVKVSHTSGVAGLGYIGLPASIGWDRLPGGAEVMAHELGHNFGRLHAPCGGPSGVDGSYPYPQAFTGLWGLDLFAQQGARAPTSYDLMSYCDPAWISDYTYTGILAFRGTGGSLSSYLSPAARRGLLIWGRITADSAILEPVFEVDAPPTLPSRGGAHRIDAFGLAGETLFSLSFDGDAMDHGPTDERLFAFVVPVDRLGGRSLSALRLTTRGHRAEYRASTSQPSSTAQRNGGRLRVGLGASARAALVRNARTGRVITISRGRSVDVPFGDEIEVIVSDGVRSTRTRHVPR